MKSSRERVFERRNELCLEYIENNKNKTIIIIIIIHVFFFSVAAQNRQMSASRLADGLQKLVAGSLGVTTVIAGGWFVASGARILSNANSQQNSKRDETKK